MIRPHGSYYEAWCLLWKTLHRQICLYMSSFLIIACAVMSQNWYNKVVKMSKCITFVKTKQVFLFPDRLALTTGKWWDMFQLKQRYQIFIITIDSEENSLLRYMKKRIFGKCVFLMQERWISLWRCVGVQSLVAVAYVCDWVGQELMKC